MVMSCQIQRGRTWLSFLEFSNNLFGRGGGVRIGG